GLWRLRRYRRPPGRARAYLAAGGPFREGSARGGEGGRHREGSRRRSGPEAQPYCPYHAQGWRRCARAEGTQSRGPAFAWRSAEAEQAADAERLRRRILKGAFGRG